MPAEPLEAPLLGSRAEIDQVDIEIARLLQRRASIVERVRAAKLRTGQDTYDPGREEEVLDRVLAAEDDPAKEGAFPRSAMRAVFREIISGCVAIQQKLAIGYMGPPGSYTESAAIALFGTSAQLRDFPVASGVLDAVARGSVAFGVVGFETSAEGLILNVVEGLLARSLNIRREYVSEITYALASPAESLSDLRVVYGHPIQIDHCRRWLSEHLPNVRLASEESPLAALENARRDPAAGVLVSKMAAERNGLFVLAERANDRLGDAMRFVVVTARAEEDVRADKTALVVKPHREAPLADLLATFATHGVELLKLASRPRPDEPWHALYFFEVRGKRSDAVVQATIGELSARFGEVTVLGSYLTHRGVSWSAPPSARAERDDSQTEPGLG